jgi:hypothetical protein
MITFSHPFITPCRYTPHCTQSDPKHFEEFSHVCEWGGACKTLDDPSHVSTTIHILHHPCMNKNCKNLSEDHLSTFSHHDIKDIRPKCKEGRDCSKKEDTEHIKKYRHPLPSPLGVCSVLPRLLVDVDYNSGTKQNQNARITFFNNIFVLKKQILEYLKVNFP